MATNYDSFFKSTTTKKPFASTDFGIGVNTILGIPKTVSSFFKKDTFDESKSTLNNTITGIPQAIPQGVVNAFEQIKTLASQLGHNLTHPEEGFKAFAESLPTQEDMAKFTDPNVSQEEKKAIGDKLVNASLIFSVGSLEKEGDEIIKKLAQKVKGETPIETSTSVSKEGLPPQTPEVPSNRIESNILESKPQIEQLPQSEVSPSVAKTQVKDSSYNKSLPQVADDVNGDPVQKLLAALKEAEPIRKGQEKLYSAERSKRVARIAAMQSKTSGERGFYAELGQLKGELPKKQFDSIREKISQKDIDSIFDMVKKSPKLDLFDQINARQGLVKMFRGEVPTTSELKLLNGVFPKEVISELLAKRPLLTRLGEGAIQALNIPRSIMSSFDLSAPFRQGVFMVGRKQFYRSFAKMFKQFGSERAFKGMQEEIASRPTYKLMKRSKLALTEMDEFLTSREEQFMSNWAEKIPVIGRVVRASGRAYVGFLNKLRADVFDDLLSKANMTGVEVTSTLTDDLAKFINSATGRGKLGALERSASVLNAVFFSPRLMASRLNMLNPIYYARLDPFVRKEALKSLLSFAGIATTVITLAKMGGAKVSGDPRNSDFGKIKVGDTRFDILGGFQQYIRLAAQLLSGKIVSSTTGKTLTLGEGYKPLTRLDILLRFFQGKENPVASFVTDFLRGQDLIGNEFKLTEAIIKRFVPLITQDLKEALKEYGAAGFLTAIPAAFGVGTQTYKSQKPKTNYDSFFK